MMDLFSRDRYKNEFVFDYIKKGEIFSGYVKRKEMKMMLKV